jgi:hypothetical protein
MMGVAKKHLILVSVLFSVNTAFSQVYIITYIKGAIYHNNTPLKLHDRLDGVSELTSSDKTAEIALFSAQKGKFRLSFENSKPISKGVATKNSELYQLMVANYLLTYTTEKTLTSRGDFDLRNFFGAKGNKRLLLEGELLPTKSEGLKNNLTDSYFICTLNGKDTVCNLIRRNNSFLIFERQLFGGLGRPGKPDDEAVTCFIKRGYTVNGKYVDEMFSGPANVTFLTREYLQDLVKTFEEGLTRYYANDKKKLITDIENQLTYYYGDSFEPALEQVLAGLIN